jgi:hypothetical protein
MATPADFRARAADCEWAATNAQDRLSRVSLLQTARLWRSLADEEEDVVQRARRQHVPEIYR